MDRTVTLDREQLREVTLDDAGFMQEILDALIVDTSRQVKFLEAAVRERDPEKCQRLAHYSKGACANVGALMAAALLKTIEHQAAAQQFADCSASIASLAREVELLREEAKTL
jgi:HPt (histidine-containing phosphotransfer) domain-containing protein